MRPRPSARAVIRPEPIDFVSYPVRVDLRRAAGRRAAHARRPARGARGGVDAARRDGLQRAVPRRPADPHRLAVVRPARGWRALDRVPPVLRALPGAARPHGPPRRPARAACCGRIPTACRSTSRRRSCRGARASTSGSCRTCISTPARSTATPPTTKAASTASGVRIDRQRLVGLVGNLRSTVAGLRWNPANTEWSDYADHTSYGDAATASKATIVGELLATTGAHDRLGPRRQHRPLQPDRGRRRAERPRVRHRPGRGRAQLPAAPRGAAGRHPAARDGPREPEPGRRLGRAGSGAPCSSAPTPTPCSPSP